METTEEQFTIGKTMSVTQKLCDFTPVGQKNKAGQPGTREVTGIRVISPLPQRDKHKEQVSKFSCYNDPLTGEVYGIPIGKNPDGSYKFQRLGLMGKRIFNLTNNKESLEYHIYKTSPHIKGSPFAGAIPPLFELFNPEEQADRFVSNRRLIKVSEDYINSLSAQDQMNFAMLMPNVGVAALRNSPLMNLKVLIEELDKNPKKMAEMIGDQGKLKVMVLLEKALGYNVVSESPTQGFKTLTGAILGANRTIALDTIRTSREIFDYITKEVEYREKEKATPVSQSKTDDALVDNIIQVMKDSGNERRTTPPPPVVSGEINDGTLHLGNISTAEVPLPPVPVMAGDEEDLFADPELVKAVSKAKSKR